MIVRALNTAMACGFLLLVFEPVGLLHLFGGWLVMVLAASESSE